MQKKQVIMLGVLVAAFGIAGYMVFGRSDKTEYKPKSAGVSKKKERVVEPESAKKKKGKKKTRKTGTTRKRTSAKKTRKKETPKRSTKKRGKRGDKKVKKKKITPAA